MNRYLTEMWESASSTTSGLTSGVLDDMSLVTWSEVHDRAKRMVGALTDVGVRRHSRVAALVTDPAEVASLAQAVWMTGSTLTMLQQPSPQASWDDWVAAIIRSLHVVGVQVVVIGRQHVDMAPALRAAGVVVVESESLDAGYPLELVEPDEDDTAMYQLTSGSTGDPKAIGITFRNLYANSGALIRAADGDRADDVMVSWLPLSHDLGMVGFLLTPMHHAFNAVKVPPTEFSRSPASWLRLITEYRGTITGAPSFAFSLMGRLLEYVQDDDAFDLSSLRFVTCAGEPIVMPAIRKFIDQGRRFGLKPSAMASGYGMAETTLGVAFSPVGLGIQTETVDRDALYAHKTPTLSGPQTAESKEMVIAGPPVLGMEVRIVDDGGEELPVRHAGGIAVRGAAVTSTYLTSDGPKPATDGQGWLHTGDIGYFTEDGQLVICGRSKNVIIVGGRNIFPGDLEMVAESVAGVRVGGVVALGVTHDDSEGVCIVAELSSGRTGVDPEDIKREVVRKVVSAVGLSPQVVLVPKGSLPRTPSGKLRHNAARELLSSPASR